MSLIPRMTLIGLYDYDETLFDAVILPDGIDKTLFVDTLLLKYGECPVLYPQHDFLKRAAGIWSRKWYDSVKRIYESLTASYNPLHNYDRYEEYKDAETRQGETGATGSTTQTNNLTDGLNEQGTVTENATAEGTETIGHGKITDTEYKVSAMNESDYQPDRAEKTTESGSTDTETSGETNTTTTTTRGTTGTHTGTVTTADTRSGTSEDSRTLEHEAHLYGNIGVTTSQDMLKAELELREDYNLYDMLADLFKEEFCLYYY